MENAPKIEAIKARIEEQIAHCLNMLASPHIRADHFMDYLRSLSDLRRILEEL